MNQFTEGRSTDKEIQCIFILVFRILSLRFVGGKNEDTEI